VRGRHFDIQADIQISDGRDVEFNLRGISLVVHAQARQLTVHGYVLPVALNDGRLHLRLLLDETSLEIFADRGLVYLPLAISPSSDNEEVTVSARAGDPNAVSLDIAEIKSIWR
jgi:sucrose-6-phosphate hydrolase SacC (GH32 family)